MRVEVRNRRGEGGEIITRGAVLIAEGKEESEVLDAVFGNQVADGDGLISQRRCECRLSDGYAEHYVYIDAQPVTMGVGDAS